MNLFPCLLVTTFATQLAVLPALAQQKPIALPDGAKSDAPLPTGLPNGLKASIFAAPPMINYPTFLCAAPNGDLYVSVDKNGSLDKEQGRGSIHKLIDTDGDGVADKKTVFADNVTSPRGLELVGGDTLVCLHPPEVTIFKDKDGDGVAEERKDIVTGIGFTLKHRAPDHTSQGVTLGIDGWLYLAIGDFGFMEATGSDGRKLQLHGGGVVRIRPDGSEMELFARGTRNIYEVAVDPWLNVFARDNPNDGGGWDTRLEHYLHGVDLGYPRRFKHFTDETFPVLGIYGGGSGVGGIFVQEKNFGWPAGYDEALYTCDWGRSRIFKHKLTDNGAGFDTEQAEFCAVDRVTDMKVDGLGRAYIASWRGGQFGYKDETVGYVIRVAPETAPAKLPDVNFAKKSTLELFVDVTNEASHTGRLHASQELLKRGPAVETKLLETAAADAKLSVKSRIAAIFTLKQLSGEKANPFLISLLADENVREFALRALGDRADQGGNVPTETLSAHLTDKNDHVRAQAIIALDRLKRKEAAAAILAIAAEDPETALLPPTEATAGDVGKKKKKSDPAEAIYTDQTRSLPHVASQALIRLGAADAAFAALDKNPSQQAASLRVLRNLHDPSVVTGLLERLQKATDPLQSHALLTAVIRLYFKEAVWDASSWGTRPDTTGPYYKRDKWSETDRIEAALLAFHGTAGDATKKHISKELARHQIRIKSLMQAEELADPQWAKDMASLGAAMVAMSDMKEGDVGLMEPQVAIERTVKALEEGQGDAKNGKQLFLSQGCIACHVVGKNDAPKGPNLYDIAQRYNPAEIMTSIINPNATVSQGFPTHTFTLQNGDVVSGFALKEGGEEIILRNMAAMTTVVDVSKIKERIKSETVSSMTPGLLNNLTPKECADLLAYFKSLAK